MIPLGPGQGHTQKASRKITFPDQGFAGSGAGPPIFIKYSGWWMEPIGKPEEQPPSEAQATVAPVWGDQCNSIPASPPSTCAEAPGKGAPTQPLLGLKCLLKPDLWPSAHQVSPHRLDKLVVGGVPNGIPGQSFQPQLGYDGTGSKPGPKAHFILLPLRLS